MQQVNMGKVIKNDAWLSKEEQANPDVLPELPGFHVLVRPVSIKQKTNSIKQKTKGGILLPDSTRDDMAYLTTVGEVVALGDLAYNDKDKFPKGAWCKKGDYVCYGKHAGQKIKYKGLKFILLFTLDPTFNLSKHSV
jgi:co-chaperonin GroES (HSP10)